MTAREIPSPFTHTHLALAATGIVDTRVTHSRAQSLHLSHLTKAGGSTAIGRTISWRAIENIIATVGNTDTYRTIRDRETMRIASTIEISDTIPHTTDSRTLPVSASLASHAIALCYTGLIAHIYVDAS